MTSHSRLSSIRKGNRLAYIFTAIILVVGMILFVGANAVPNCVGSVTVGNVTQQICVGWTPTILWSTDSVAGMILIVIGVVSFFLMRKASG